MGKIMGLGGPFIKAKDPKALAAWYQEILGINFNGGTYTVFPFPDKDSDSPGGYNVLSFFGSENPYFSPSKKETMLNFRVSDLDGLIADLQSKKIELHGEPISEEYGKFAWIMDPEGNKIELWEPV